MDEYTKQSQLRVARLEEESQLRESVRKAEGKEARQVIRDRFDETQRIIEEGGIYDVSTDTYEPTKGNESGVDTNLDRTGIHEASRPRAQDGAGEDEDEDLPSFDIIVCVNGEPYNAFVYGEVGGAVT